jgi:predicted DNA-binding transcriptional regulator AlpA
MDAEKLIGLEARLLDVRGAARYMNISPAHFLRLDARGLVPRGIRLGRCRRWDPRELADFVAAGAPSRDRWEQIRRAGK